MDLKQLIAELYSDPELMARFKADPAAVFAEHGATVPDGIEFRVVKDSADLRHVVLPYLDERLPPDNEQLERRAARCFFGHPD